MTTYRFLCHACKLGWEGDFPMADTEGRKAATSPGCGGPVVRDFSTTQFRKRIGWREFTHYDLLPPDVKGAGPYSKEFRRYADKTESSTRRGM